MPISDPRGRHVRRTGFTTRHAGRLLIAYACRARLQTWLACSGRSRTHDPSLSHNRPLGFCFFGTFSPSRRQIRSTRPTSKP